MDKLEYQVYTYNRAIGMPIAGWYRFSSLELAADWCDQMVPPDPVKTRWEVIRISSGEICSPDRPWIWEI